MARADYERALRITAAAVSALAAACCNARSGLRRAFPTPAAYSHAQGSDGVRSIVRVLSWHDTSKSTCQRYAAPHRRVSSGEVRCLLLN